VITALLYAAGVEECLVLVSGWSEVAATAARTRDELQDRDLPAAR
jgi:hypothetical protein